MLFYLTCGPDFFPGWVSVLFSVGLALGIVHRSVAGGAQRSIRFQLAGAVDHRYPLGHLTYPRGYHTIALRDRRRSRRNRKMLFKKNYLGRLPHASHLIGGETNGRAVVVDPQCDGSEYVAGSKAAWNRMLKGLA